MVKKNAQGMLSDLQGAPSALCFKINLRQLGLQCKTGSRVADGVWNCAGGLLVLLWVIQEVHVWDGAHIDGGHLYSFRAS